MMNPASPGGKPRRAAVAAAVTLLLVAVGLACVPLPVRATPANRAALSRFFGRFLARRLDNCNTCHLPLRPGKSPASLADFPHNPFGSRLRSVADALRRAGKKTDIGSRILAIADEDSDGDGVDNLTELLLGHAPGDPTDWPSAQERTRAATLRAAFKKYLAGYRWQPFETVHRPAVPRVKSKGWVRNPIDAFIAAEHEARGLRPRPPASRDVLLRRVYLDLVGLAPAPEEIRAFEKDTAPDAYEKVVDRLLASPRYGERWGRHWMDVWRYSDWAGWGAQVRDSKPHIWRWRDWIVDSLNRDKGYDRMALEMLAADELCPEDMDALRATGFLVRNYKLLSREQWLEDTVKHTCKALLGITMGCARCHDHMYDPFPQQDYYRLRAIFEPHNVRTDRVPGQPDTDKDGLVRAYDADPKAVTYLYYRGDERHPDKDHLIPPGVPAALGGTFEVRPVKLSPRACFPDRRDFVVRETIAAGEQAVADARKALDQTRADGSATPEKRHQALLAWEAARARHLALLAVLNVEKIEDDGRKGTDAWKQAATQTVEAQRQQALQEASLNVLLARSALAVAQAKGDAAASGLVKIRNGKRTATLETMKANVTAAEKALTQAEADLKVAPTTAYRPRSSTAYPDASTGRRLAFARWLTDRAHPLTARVAVNHIWARHFGQGIVPSLSDFGRNGRPPSHPQLLDWLAAEFMARGWSMKRLHRLIVTSSTYRMASTLDTADAKRDPDNTYLWRMSSRRMEAEVVRDNVLYASGQLDETMGGPEVDHNQGLVSKRRSIYLRIAAEKEVEFLKIFDSPSVTECYERKQTVMPQQALALANSELTQAQSHVLADALAKQVGADNKKFVDEAFLRVLARRPTAQEMRLCVAFLARPAPTGGSAAFSDPHPRLASNESGAPSTLRARQNLVLVLFNHNDFVTIR